LQHCQKRAWPVWKKISAETFERKEKKRIQIDDTAKKDNELWAAVEDFLFHNTRPYIRWQAKYSQILWLLKIGCAMIRAKNKEE